MSELVKQNWKSAAFSWAQRTKNSFVTYYKSKPVNAAVNTLAAPFLIAANLVSPYGSATIIGYMAIKTTQAVLEDKRKYPPVDVFFDKAVPVAALALFTAAYAYQGYTHQGECEERYPRVSQLAQHCGIDVTRHGFQQMPPLQKLYQNVTRPRLAADLH